MAEAQDLMSSAHSVLDQLGCRRRKSLKTDLTLNEKAIGMIARHSPGRRGLGVLAIFWRIGTGRRNSAADREAETRKEDWEQL